MSTTALSKLSLNFEAEYYLVVCQSALQQLDVHNINCGLPCLSNSLEELVMGNVYFDGRPGSSDRLSGSGQDGGGDVPG